MNVLIDQINDLLPQTQCGQCGFKGCLPYAQAIAEGRADINQCPPGGEQGIHDLALLLNQPVKLLNTNHGVIKPAQVAFIVEQDCIGCVKCINACPVDAIIGAAKFMHTVIVSECTGCELCVLPCPVDCIIMQPISETASVLSRKDKAKAAKRRYEARNQRKQQQAIAQAEKAKAKKAALFALKNQ